MFGEAFGNGTQRNYYSVSMRLFAYNQLQIKMLGIKYLAHLHPQIL